MCSHSAECIVQAINNKFILGNKKEAMFYFGTACYLVQDVTILAIKTHERYNHIENEHIRFYKITSVILVMAQRTTAGVMVKFYYDMQRLKAIMMVKLK